MFYTYAHYTPSGDLFYIGKGNDRRAYDFSGRNVFWQRIVKKYGKPDVQILANWDTEEEAFSHEMLLISCFKEMNMRLCNLTDGGEGSYGLTPWNKGRPWSAEIKQKCGLKNKNNKYWIGRKHSEETKQQQSFVKTKYKFIGTNVVTKEQIVLLGKKNIVNAGFTPTHVYACANNLCKAHKGYTWKKESVKG